MARSDAELDRLEAAAAAWVGTPWCDNSGTIGAGACCHRLLAAVYVAAGWLPEFDLPRGISGHARGNDRPVMLEWFRTAGDRWFEEVQDVQTGDALLIHVGHAPHHLGLALRDGRVLHVSTRQGVRIIQSGGQWLRLLAHAFRPKTV
jgi:glyoxylase-like metal-dependent hydrolase (beta-lactamase superfamily II)